MAESPPHVEHPTAFRASVRSHEGSSDQQRRGGRKNKNTTSGKSEKKFTKVRDRMQNRFFSVYTSSSSSSTAAAAALLSPVLQHCQRRSFFLLQSRFTCSLLAHLHAPFCSRTPTHPSAVAPRYHARPRTTSSSSAIMSEITHPTIKGKSINSSLLSFLSPFPFPLQTRATTTSKYWPASGAQQSPQPLLAAALRCAEGEGEGEGGRTIWLYRRALLVHTSL